MFQALFALPRHPVAQQKKGIQSSKILTGGTNNSNLISLVQAIVLQMVEPATAQLKKYIGAVQE